MIVNVSFDTLSYLFILNIFKITPVPSIINTVQSMEPSKPKAPPFIRLASGQMECQHALTEFIPADFISQDRTLYPVPEPM